MAAVSEKDYWELLSLSHALDMKKFVKSFENPFITSEECKKLLDGKILGYFDLKNKLLKHADNLSLSALDEQAGMIPLTTKEQRTPTKKNSLKPFPSKAMYTDEPGVAPQLGWEVKED